MVALPFDVVGDALRQDPYWGGRVGLLRGEVSSPVSLHLAVFVQPYLDYMLEGRKTVESRFSVVRCAPFQQVRRGDIMLLKLSGGPVLGVCEVGETWSYRLQPDSWRSIRREFAEALCAQDPEFWHQRKQATYATLMHVKHVSRIVPVPWPKRDRRGWVVLRPGAPDGPLFGAQLKGTVLAFSGGIASGKSAVSTGVAEALNCARVSFGNVVRKETKSRGLRASRENWQLVGEGLVRDVEGFCRRVLAEAEWRPGEALVVDGIRHAEVMEVLRRLVQPSVLRLVHVAADGATRATRFRRRGGLLSSLDVLEAHSTEMQVNSTLLSIADFVVNGTRPLERVVGEVVQWVRDLP